MKKKKRVKIYNKQFMVGSKVSETYLGSAILDCASFVQFMYTSTHGSYLLLHNLSANMYINYKTVNKKQTLNLKNKRKE